MKIICIIPARKNSKRIKNKNIKKIFSKSLIYWTINFAKKLNNISDIIVTTDSKKIQEISKKNSLKYVFKRNKSLSKSSTPMIDVVKDVLRRYKKRADAILLLQPTTPYRNIFKFNKTIRRFIITKEDMISVGKKIKNKDICSIKKNRIFFNKKSKKLMTVNGALYLIKVKSLLKNNSFKLNNSTPIFMGQKAENFNLDTNIDWKNCISYFKINKKFKQYFKQ
tara:strand:+ start:92 stop:760 length:669 start_codon:yes stop_codon:yes gene_type:complete